MSASDEVKTSFKMDLPNFSKMPELTTLNTQFVSSFNTGLTIYQCLNYLEGYVELTYEGLVKLIEELEEFRTELITYIETMETDLNNKIQLEAEQRKATDEKLNNDIEVEKDTRELEDAKLQEHIHDEEDAREQGDKDLDDKKVNRAGDTMTGDLTLPNAYLSGAIRTTTGTGNPAILAGYTSKVEVGTSGRSLNMVGSASRPTYNTSNQIAFLSDITGGGDGNVEIFKKDANNLVLSEGVTFSITTSDGIEDPWDYDLLVMVFGGQFSDSQSYQHQAGTLIADLKNMPENDISYLNLNDTSFSYLATLSQAEQVTITQRIMVEKAIATGTGEKEIHISSQNSNYTQIQFSTSATSLMGYCVNGQNPPHLLDVYLVKVNDTTTATATADETQEGLYEELS